VLMSLFFSAIFPVGYWYSAFACLICFWVDKYCVLRLFRQKPPAGDRLVRLTRTFTAIVVLIHAIITSHFYYSWPFDNLCDTDDVLTPEGRRRAALLGITTNSTYKMCNSVSSSLIPPPVREDWMQHGDVQVRLVQFFNVVSILMIVYICIVYFGSDSASSVYALFYYKHQAVGEATTIPYDTVTTGEGYVPQFVLEGMSHSILTCVAPVPASKELNGGLEFDSYLLNWTASKERTGEETQEELAVDLTEEEKDAIYRKNNVYFDDQLQGMDQHKIDTVTFARAKQYIRNAATAEAGAFAMTVAGRARASTVNKEKRGSMRKSEGAVRRMSNSVIKVLGVGVSETGNSDLEKMADAAEEEERRESNVVEYPANMSGGGTYA
jgi:hypothetical protein